jgi:nickel/cobalt exporter
VTERVAKLRRVRLRLVCFAAVAFAVLACAGAGAHPLGNFTVNRSSILEVSPHFISVRYAVDVAEVPTFQEFATIDADKNNAASAAELSSYARSKAAFLVGGLRLTVDESALRLSVVSASAALNPGQGGLQVLRLDVVFSAPLARTTARIDYRDDNFESLPGWREVAAIGVSSERVASSDVPLVSPSGALRAYPTDLLRHPPATTAALFTVEPGTQIVPPARPRDARSVATTRLFGRDFAALVQRDLTLPSIVVAMLLAMGFGAVHAIGPGHGKTVMATYLVGSSGRARHAVGLGVAVSLMHTISVIALGLLTLWLTNLFSPAAVYPWLALVSGVTILGLGARLFATRLRARNHAHEHAPPTVPGASPFSRKGLTAIAVSGGLVPSPTAVVVLLAAVSLHRIAFGVILVAAFSIGLAVALSAAGVLVLRAHSYATLRWSLGPTSMLPVLSSAVLFGVGVYLTLRAAVTL